MIGMIIGSLGVFLLLLAFALNLTRVISERSTSYLLMNFIGAGMAAYYAFVGGMIPFVILETVWAMTALVRFFMIIKKARLGRAL